MKDTVLITGANGFLGKYIADELKKDNNIITLGRKGAMVNVDLSQEIPNLQFVDHVVHCAGKAHTEPKTDMEKQAFFNVNLHGTENLLKALENCEVLPSAFVFISTVAVYGCESGNMISEKHPLNANDPYGQSKIQAEKLIQEWCTKNNIVCSILRLPLLVGKNPPGNLGNMINGIKRGYYFNIAGGKAKKSMVLTKDVAHLIPLVAKVGGIYNLTDGYHPSFRELSILIAKKLDIGTPLCLPLWIGNIIAKIGDLLGNVAPINSKKLMKIITDLTFDDSKAKRELNWNPNKVLLGQNNIL